VLARGIDGQDAADVKLLASLLAPRKPPELHAAAVTALVRTARATVPALLFAGWQAHSPSLRNQILDAMATREIWALEVLDAVEQGKIAASQLDARRRQQFLSARSKAVRDRAEKVLAGSIDPNRQKLLETYLPVAAKGGGDVARGKAVYAKRCANCHKLEGAGYSVGPDLAALTSRPADYLLTSILDPNRAVEDRYLEYVVLTTDGRQVNGILLEETGASLTLAAPKLYGRLTLRRSDFRIPDQLPPSIANLNVVEIDSRDPARTAVALAAGLVDYKVCSVDADWSGCKFTRKK
jgi:putative heme-binding domain-containing protein